MHRTRTASHAPARLALATAAIVLASGVSGCHWFGKKDELYTQSVESRPLEVPPDLDRPSADRAMALPSAGGSATASGVASAAGSPGAAAPIGFSATAASRLSGMPRGSTADTLTPDVACTVRTRKFASW